MPFNKAETTKTIDVTTAPAPTPPPFPWIWLAGGILALALIAGVVAFATKRK